jgi:DNA repair protein RecN (Recombination protein N)
MLLELSVQNLLLIEDARLELTDGLNVITGETGAGKTVLAGALDLLLGGRPRPGIVRPGASEAYVEGIFELPDGFAHEQLAADAGELVLARRVGVDGRTRAYLGGRSIPVGELRELAGELLSFYGQHEHRRLMLAAAQLEILDAYAGAEQARRCVATAAAWSDVSDARDELARLAELAGARERELDLLDFELTEIERVAPAPGEREELAAERERLRNVEALRHAAYGAEQALADDEAGGQRALHAAASTLDAAASLDPGAEALATRARAIAIEAQDLVSEIRQYGEGLEVAPGRLEAVDERLTAIVRLERKHGGSVESVLAHAAGCRVRRDELAGAEVATQVANVRLEAALADHAAHVAELSAARARAAPRLAKAVAARLDALAMADARFAITLQPCEPGRTGAERAQFELAPNPGVAPAPLRDIASGGELSRVMLALLTAPLSRGAGGSRSTLVFDEIDAGVGGHTARAVAAQLRTLADSRQVLAITHLPQVASVATRHFTIIKDTGRAPARTTVRRLGAEDVVGELVRMLGADAGDSGARRHAKELLKAA